jgi:hypothetical protein
MNYEFSFLFLYRDGWIRMGGYGDDFTTLRI